MSRHSFQAWAQTAEHRNESAPPYVPLAEEALAWVIIAAVIYLGARWDRASPPPPSQQSPAGENILDPAAAYLVFRDIRSEGRG